MSDTQVSTRIFVLYNAKASLLGKLSYGYQKLRAPADDSPCAACDLTHGGLRLQESDEWKATKAKIPATVEQRHMDELTPEVSNDRCAWGKQPLLVFALTCLYRSSFETL